MLLAKDIHLKKGTHKVVVCENFYDVLSVRDEKSKQYVFKNIKAAYDRLNEVNTGVQFELCTTSYTVADNYDLKYVDYVDVNSDIVLDMIAGKFEENPKAAAIAHCDWDEKTRELKDLKITLRLKWVNAKWVIKSDEEKHYAVDNSYIYSVILHEALHTMGFAHQDDENSIMYYKTKQAHDFSPEDLEMINKYNEVFYGTKQNIATYSQKQEEPEELTF